MRRRIGGIAVRLVSARSFGQLQEVVGDADHRPFASDLIEPMQQELPEASGLLDLPEHRLDDLLSQAVAASAAGLLQARSHGAHQGCLRQLAPPCRIRLAMACTSWSQIGRDPALLQRGKVRLVGKASIARDLTRFAAEMDADVIDQRHETTGVRGVCHEAVRHDDLMGCIDGDLAVVALYEPHRGSAGCGCPDR